MLREFEKQQMLERIYPDSASVPLSRIEVPSILGKLVEDLRGVARYVDSTQTPEGSVDDNVKDHLFRLQWRLMTLPESRVKNIPSEIMSQCRRQIWIHDTGELGDENDVVVTAKIADERVAQSVELKEREVAKRVLSQRDYTLYEDFEAAGSYLRGKRENCSTGHGLLAKTMDFVDGPLVYFYFFTKWLETHGYDGEIPPEGVFTYTLSENNKFRTKILQAKRLEVGVRDTCLYLLSEQIKGVVSLWDEVEKTKTPPIMFRQLDLMQDYLEVNG